MAQVIQMSEKRTASIDELAERVAEQVRAHGKPWPEVARMVLRSKEGPTLGRSDLIELAARGLAVRARDLDAQRYTADRAEQGHTLPTVADVMDAERPKMLNALWATKYGADENKAFAMFDSRDRAVFARSQRERGQGYIRSADFTDKVDTLCVRNKVKLVKDLPADVQVGLLKEVPW